MFAVLDKTYLSSQAVSSPSSISKASNAFTPFLILSLKKNLDSLTLFSDASADQLLLDKAASQPIGSDKWLKKVNWKPLEEVELPTNIPSFIFASHFVVALSGVLLAASITDLEDTKHIFQVLAYFLLSTPIPFLLGLTDQRVLGFEICVRKGHSSNLLISTWHKIL